MKTFVYKGPAEKLRVLGHELRRNQPFTTDDKKLVERLTLLIEVEEVKPGEQEEKRRSRKSDAVES